MASTLVFPGNCATNKHLFLTWGERVLWEAVNDEIQRDRSWTSQSSGDLLITYSVSDLSQ